MESFPGPVAAGILVSLLNRYNLDFKWCTVLQTWYEDADDDEDDERDMTPSSSTAISSDAIMTHHVVTHVH